MLEFPESAIDPHLARWGAKAANLSYLKGIGAAVPPFAVLAAGEALPGREQLQAALRCICAPGADGSFPVAVRSSAIGEDTDEQSMAGSFLTLLGELEVVDVLEAIQKVRQSAAGLPVGVIVQRLITAEYAGAIFSLNPVTYSRDTMTVAYTSGRGDQLMAGEIDGQTVLIPRTGELGALPTHNSASDPNLSAHVAKLRDQCLAIERDWSSPVDMEWAVEAATGTVWTLQARPVVLPRPTEVLLGSVAAIDGLPEMLKGHSKINLRRRSAVKDIDMSRASVAVVTEHDVDLGFVPTADAAGISVVLLFPERIDSSIVREFSAVQGDDVEFYTRECRRYAIRRYPDQRDLSDTVRAILAKGLERSWFAACIVQEIYDAPWTGILRRFGDGFVAELAEGHFVPKGIVSTSRYVFDDALHVISREVVAQDVAYRFMDGHVVRELRPERGMPPEALLSQGIGILAPMAEDQAVEFGLMEDGLAYLIDIAESDQCMSTLSSTLIDHGVISTGRAEGAVRVLGTGSEIHTLDAHLNDLADSAQERIEGRVFLAPRASTDLLPLIYRCGANCGFVFRTGSLLNHVAVVLRELGIPGIVVGDKRWWKLVDTKAGTVLLDAVSTDLAEIQRVRAVAS